MQKLLILLLLVPSVPALYSCTSRTEPVKTDDLVELVKTGNLEATERTVNTNPLLANSKRDDGVPLLYFAAANGHAKIVSYLLSKGAEVDAKADYGGAIHIATEKEYATIVRTLLQWKANPNLKDKWGQSPLHKATRNSNAQIAQMLIQAVGDVSSVDSEGRTPLHRCKSVAVAKALLEAGANINSLDGNGYNALHWAATPREIVDTATIKFLLARGINASAKEKTGLTPLELAKKSEQTVLVTILENHATGSKNP
jgi:ankyrin repeat protein